LARPPLSDSGRLKSARWFRNLAAVAILFTLLWFLLGFLEQEFQRAEEQSAGMVISHLRSALVIKGAEVMLDRNASLEEQEGINPFELIDHQWGSYAGQCAGDIPEPGNWCFREWTQKETKSEGRGRLIYNPRQPLTVHNRYANAGEPLAWKVTTEFGDRNGNGQRERNERLTGLKLLPVPFIKESAPTQRAAR